MSSKQRNYKGKVDKSVERVEDMNEKQMNKRNSSKRQRRNKEVIDTAIKDEGNLVGGRSCLRSSSENDPEWYASDPQLLQDAFNLSFADRLGLPVQAYNADYSNTLPPYGSYVKYRVSGLMRIGMVPVPGISTSGQSAVNVAARKLFTYVRHANSGAANYQAPDLMMYLLAMDNAFTLWNWLVRIYGVAQVFSGRNAYLPSVIFEADNVDYQSICSNLNQLRTAINIMGKKLMTMKVPGHLAYFKRHAWLFSNIFLDSPNAKAQMYMYSPSYLYKWNEYTPTGELAYLSPVAINRANAKWKFDGLMSLINDFVDPIFYSEDFNLMSGDILKAYDEANCITVPIIEPDYVVLPVPNQEVGMQIENADIPINPISIDGSWNITQSNKEELIFNPIVTVNRNELGDYKLLNFHHDSVTPADVAVATRLNRLYNITTVEFTKGITSSPAELESCGSEIVDGGKFYYLSDTNAVTSTHAYSTYVTTNMKDTYGRMCRHSQFDWSPIAKVYYQSGSGDALGSEFVGVFGDLDNYTNVSWDVLTTMNDVALLSMFGIPGSAGR